MRIKQGFWAERLAINAQRAIFHQWQQLEASGCIENFRIAAGESQQLRTGWFFADSDAYKWLEAAARIWAESQDARLGALIDDFIGLLSRAQMQDGYLFTYNQVHFPGTRWQNLQIEHELYCHGHLIEAGVSHFEAAGRTDLLEIARKAADRIVADFLGRIASFTPGHEEIEIALLRLHQVFPGEPRYLQLARQLIEKRGTDRKFALSLLQQQANVDRRGEFVRAERQKYLADHPDFHPFQLPPNNPALKPPLAKMRWMLSALNGKYFQQHTGLRNQTRAEGHSVRFAYLQTAAAMLARLDNDRTLLAPLERAWDSMVLRRMYVTGGIGSLPELEGFGRDYELDDEYAYAETCAALGSLFWNWQMALLTGEAKYSDLFEWQLHNAAAVGMGSSGKSYFYNNPLACRSIMTRHPWYKVPCCPSNLSRTFADLGEYVFSSDPCQITLHQYISCSWTLASGSNKSSQQSPLTIDLNSALPWKGELNLRIDGFEPDEMVLRLRQPSWAEHMEISLNGVPLAVYEAISASGEDPASGYDPRCSVFRSISRQWQPGDELEIRFTMPVLLRKAHPRVKGHKNKIAVTRGPLVYCLESVDNPGIDLFSVKLDTASLSEVWVNDEVKIRGKSRTGEKLLFTPYYAWGNRGPSQMTVWVNT